MLGVAGKASAPPFLQCARIVDALEPSTRDRRKGNRYTADLIAQAAKARKKIIGKGGGAPSVAVSKKAARVRK
jgi:hypothetical protein